MFFGDIEEGLLEMPWQTADAYIQGFGNMEEEQQKDIIYDLQALYFQTAEQMEYSLDDDANLEGIEDDFERYEIYGRIEQRFNEKVWECYPDKEEAKC